MSVDDPSVLIVDDDVAVLSVLAAQLRQAGIAACEAQSADQALKLLGLRPIDVVITDLRMPGMDGMALLDRITGEWPGVPVILLTAHASIQLAVEAMKR